MLKGRSVSGVRYGRCSTLNNQFGIQQWPEVLVCGVEQLVLIGDW